MKKSTKVILITAAVLLGTGILLTTIAGFTGAGSKFVRMAENGEFNYSFIPDYHNWKIETSDHGVNISSDNCEDDWDCEDEDDDDDISSYNKVENNGDMTVIATAEDKIENLKLELGKGKFRFEESPDENFYISYENNNKLYVKNHSNELSIRSKNKKSFLFHDSDSLKYDATIYLPNKSYRKIQLSLGAGTFKGMGLTADSIDAELGAGTFELDSLSANSIDMEIGAGTCYVKNIKSQELEIELAMGSLETNADIEKELAVKVAMGEAVVNVRGSQEDFDYDVECGAGDAVIGDQHYSGLANDYNQNNEGNKKLDIECGMGSIAINFNE